MKTSAILLALAACASATLLPHYSPPEVLANIAHENAVATNIYTTDIATALDKLRAMQSGPITPETVKEAQRLANAANAAKSKIAMSMDAAEEVASKFDGYETRGPMFDDLSGRGKFTDRADMNDFINTYSRKAHRDAEQTIQANADAVKDAFEAEKIAGKLARMAREAGIDIDSGNGRKGSGGAGAVAGASGSAQEQVPVAPLVPPVTVESGSTSVTSDVPSNHGDRETDKQGDASATPVTKDDKASAAKEEKASIAEERSGADGSPPDLTTSGDQLDKSPAEPRSAFDVVKRNPIKTAAGVALATAAIWSIRALLANRRRRAAMNATITTNSTVIPTTISAPSNITTIIKKTKVKAKKM